MCSNEEDEHLGPAGNSIHLTPVIESDFTGRALEAELINWRLDQSLQYLLRMEDR
jgi:hypothetical protein